MENTSWKSDLNCLFKPKSIALIGASDTSYYGQVFYKNLKKVGYEGKIFPVNPKHAEVFGLPCYPDITAIPDAVDSVVISTPASSVIPALEQCLEKKIGAGIIISGGFAEASEEGRELQKAVIALAEQGKMRIVGPNSFGVANVHGKVATFVGEDIQYLTPGKMGFIFQSGGLLNLIQLAAWDRGWGVSYLISCGNQAVLSVADYLDYLVSDEETKVIGIFAEEIKDHKKFITAADRAVATGKPVIILKIGKSAKGKESARLHTGSDVGSDNEYDTLFTRHGIVRVADLNDFIETVELFSKRKKIARSGVGIMSPSGGECSLIADIANDVGISLPDLAPLTRERIAAVQSPFLSVSNPLNAPERVVTRGEVFRECVESLIADENLGIIGVRLSLPRLRERKEVIERFLDMARASAMTDKLLVFFSRASVSLPEYWRKLLRENNIPFLSEYRGGFKAIKALIAYDCFIAGQENGSNRQEPGGL